MALVCSFTDCGRTARSKGHCATHAAQRRRGEDLRPIRPMARREYSPGTPCRADVCERPSEKQGYCGTHYSATRRGGHLNPLDVSPLDWFFSRVVPGEGDCWLWDRGVNQNGYGQFLSRGARKNTYAHRWAYEALRAEIPEGLVIDHLCRTHACVNPWHLEPVPSRVNWIRGVAPSAINKRKTHCKYGHEFSPENTIRRASGGRRCRQCMNDYNSALAAKRKVG